MRSLPLLLLLSPLGALGAELVIEAPDYWSRYFDGRSAQQAIISISQAPRPASMAAPRFSEPRWGSSSWAPPPGVPARTSSGLRSYDGRLKKVWRAPAFAGRLLAARIGAIGRFIGGLLLRLGL